jgi:hypothetical protein
MMPKSTATSRPGRRTGCPDACRRGRSRRAARAQEGLDHRCGRAPAGRWPAARAALDTVAERMPSIHSVVSTRFGGALPVRPPARGSRDRRWSVLRHLGQRCRLEPQVHLHRDRAGQGVDDGDRLEAPRCRREALGSRAAKKKSRDRGGSGRATPGRSTLTATSLPSPSRTSRLCTWAIEAAATGGPNSTKIASSGAPSGLGDDRRARLASRNGGTGPAALRGRRRSRADHVGPRREELAELHIGRAEPGERGGQPVGASEPAPRRSISRAERQAEPRRRRQVDGSTSANTPSRARRKPARASRARGDGGRSPSAAPRVTASSRNGARRCRRSEACRRAARSRRRDHRAKACGRGNLRIDSTRYW